MFNVIMNKSVFFLLIPFVPVFIQSCHKSESKVQAEAPEIDVDVVKSDSVVLHSTYPGTLVAKREVDLVARVNGYLLTQNYNPGDFVREGTVLFTIEDRNYRDAVAQAEAALSTAKATYQYSSSRYEAMKRALESDAVSKMEVEQAKSATEEAAASIKTAEAALQTARTQLSYCTVRAPFDGHMTLAQYDVGSFVGGEGSPVPLAKIYLDETMYVDFSIEDADALANIKARVADSPGLYDSIKIVFSEPLAHEYTARLDYMAPRIDTSTGTMKLQGLIDNPYGELRSGMYATVYLPSGTDAKALLVDGAAIATDQLGDYIYVVNDSNKVVYTPVKTGETVADTLRIVTSGVKAGDRYVTKALLKVREGMTVRPKINN